MVVNDLGGSMDGSGGSSAAADRVVAEIKAMGGEAIANGSSVTDDAGVEKMVEDAMGAFGRIDILIANAGVLRDKSFSKMEIKDFEFVLDVHLMGTVKCAKAVWEIMKGQNYGRIVVTTSSSGLYGNFGQSNYGAAKLGIVGFMNTLKIEGQKQNIHVNAISPVAATRMTEGLMSEAVLAMLKPEAVTPAVVYLASDEAPTGCIVTAGAGVFSLARDRGDARGEPERGSHRGGRARPLGADRRRGRPEGLCHRWRAGPEDLRQAAGLTSGPCRAPEWLPGRFHSTV